MERSVHPGLFGRETDYRTEPLKSEVFAPSQGIPSVGITVVAMANYRSNGATFEPHYRGGLPLGNASDRMLFCNRGLNLHA